tara:strand:+ start:3407 stop:5335 length:1929 start_codon:yes stop_codon:yes gene_type:complete
MIIAEKELTAEYGSEAAKVKYYQDLIKTEEEYIRKVQDAQLKAIEDNKESKRGGAGDDFTTRQLALAGKSYNDASNASVDSAKLGIEASKIKQNISQDDPTLVTASSRISENLDAAQITSNNPNQLASQVSQAVSDPAFRAAMQNADPIHRRAAGANLAQDLVRRGMDPTVAGDIVAKSLGVDTADLDPRMIQADREAMMAEVDQYASAGNAGKLRELGDTFMKRAKEGDGVAVSPVEKEAVERFTKDPQYAAVKKYVSENGSIDGYPDPTIVEDYGIVKDIIGKSPKAFSDNDTRYFDETYLVRQKQITDADKRIADAKERMSAIDQLSPPKIEDIRRRAAEIDRPQRQRGLIESQATKSFYGDHPAKNLTDAQKIMMQQTSKAYKSVSDPNYAAQRAADKSKSRTFSDNLWSQYKNGTLDPKQLSAKAAELAGGDLQYRNEIISKFLENQISDKQSGKFTKVDAQGTPMKAETPKAPKTSGMDAPASAQVAPIARAPQAPITPVMDEEDLATLAAKRASLRGTMARDTVGDRVGSKLSQGRIEILNYLTNRNRTSTEGAAYVGDDNFMQSVSDSTSVPLSNRYGSQVGTIDNPPMRGGTNRPVSPSIGTKPVEPVQTVLTPEEAEAIQSWRDLQRELRKK